MSTTATHLSASPQSSPLDWNLHCRRSWRSGPVPVHADSGDVCALVLRDLSAVFDAVTVNVQCNDIVNKVASACFHYIRRLIQVHRLLGRDVTMRLVSAFTLSRLDYCNAVLASLPNIPLSHFSGHKMPLFVWWPALYPEIMPLQHFDNYTGCHNNIVSLSN